jgi:hypothetical protein
MIRDLINNESMSFSQIGLCHSANTSLRFPPRMNDGKNKDQTRLRSRFVSSYLDVLVFASRDRPGKGGGGL